MKQFVKNKIQHVKEHGFSLVETLVAISILLVVIITPMTIAYRGMQMVYFANEETTAVFLAQEALESVIKMRDDNALDVLYGSESDTWDWPSNGNMHSRCFNSGLGCDYEVDVPDYRGCNPVCRIKIESGASEYKYLSTNSSGAAYTDTPFTRKIYVNRIGGAGGDRAEVTVTVSWEAHLFRTNREVVLQTWIYDHYDRFEP